MPRIRGWGPWAAGLPVAAVLLATTVASAQVARLPAGEPRGPRIDAVDVEQVPRLVPGVSLVFTVTGSPGAAATLAVEGAVRAQPMREIEPGVYEATLTVRDGDRIAADARVVATLRHGDRVAREPLREPLVLGTAMAQAPVEPDPAPEPSAWSRAGRALPRAEAVPSRVGAPVPVVAAAVPPSRAPVPVPLPATDLATDLACDRCAVVVSIRAVEGDDNPQRAGAFASAVTGSVLGERFGEAHGRRVTRIWNVLSGRRPDAAGTTRWDVVLRAADGTTVLRRYDERPPFAVGDTLQLDAGAVATEAREAPWR